MSLDTAVAPAHRPGTPGRAARRRGGLRPRPAALLRALEVSSERVAVVAHLVAGLRPWGIAIGPMGWIALVASAVAGWAGLRWHWDEAVVLAFVGVAVLLVAAAFLVGRSPYAVSLTLAHHRVVVGERAVGRVEVRNTSRGTTLPAEVELPVGRSVSVFALPRLAGGASHEDLFTIPTRRRTVITLGPVRSVRGDPLGVARREVRWTEPTELFVHPRTVALSGSSAGFLKDLEGRPTRVVSPSDISFHALREYVVGDDRRHIHWRSSARTGQLMVRQFEETRRSHLAVALSTLRSDYGEDPEEFELAVSVAGSLGLYAFREERDLTVLADVGPLRTHAAGSMLDDLTRVGLGARRADVTRLAERLARLAPDASIAFLLTGSQVPLATLQAAAVRLPAEVQVVAFRCLLGEPSGRRAFAGLDVVTIGSLDDLPVALHRLGDA